MKNAQDPEWLERVKRIHPHALMMYVGMGGSLLIFVLFVMMYLRHPVEQPLMIPPQLRYSTMVMVCLSLVLWRAMRHFDSEQIRILALKLLLAAVLAILFAILQYQAYAVWNANLILRQATWYSYLMLIAVLHGIHLVVGIGILLYVLPGIIRASMDHVKAVIFTTDPFHQNNLRMLVQYWHFLDAIWIGVFLVFLLR